MNAHTASTAVMARRIEPGDSLDFFPTPPWATRALCHHVLPRFERRTAEGKFWLTAYDPACGEGHMALALEEYFSTVAATDIFHYGYSRAPAVDFLHPQSQFVRRDWIITNPPFNLGGAFVKQALRIATRGVAMLVRMQFLEGEGRFAKIFRDTPPALIAQFIERVPMHRGRWVVNGTTATAYAWLVWMVNEQPPVDPLFTWIPKSRRALSKPDDWLRFSGCMDLPKEHAAMKALEELERIRAEAGKRSRAPQTKADFRMEALL